MPVLKLKPLTPEGIDSIPVEDAVARVRAYCSDPLSGWHTYDLPAHMAREHGVFDEVSPWSILWAEALNGQPRARDIVGFDRTVRRKIADDASRFRGRTLAQLSESEVSAVSDLCSEGFKGVWAAKLTKVLALYMPAVVPVLDGNVARALGLPRSSFRGRSRRVDGLMHGRKESISEAIHAMWVAQRDNEVGLRSVREAVTAYVPDFRNASDVRLLDVILWTSQVDRSGPNAAWVNVEPDSYAPIDLTPVRIGRE